MFGIVLSQQPKISFLLKDATWTQSGLDVCQKKYRFTETLVALNYDEYSSDDPLIRKFLIQKRIKPIVQSNYDDQESLACAEKMEGLSFGLVYGLLNEFPD